MSGLNELLMACARRNHLPVASDPFVDACPRATAVGASSIDLELPASAQAGDVVVAQLTHHANNTSPPTTSGPAGSIKAIADQQFVWLTSVQGDTLAVCAVYLVYLTAADITAGKLTFGISPADSMVAFGAVFRGVSQSMLDWSGATAADGSESPQTSPAAFAAPGYATVTDGAMLITGAAIAGAAPPDQDLSTPGGYTLGASTSSDYNDLQQIAYALQAAHGDVPDVDYAYSQGSTNTFGWCAWALALKAAKAAITLTGAFPTAPRVGAEVSFDVVATLVDGATGALTITVDALPDGLTLGETTAVGPTAPNDYKATVSGTYATVEMGTSTYTATGGSVAATPLVHAYNVKAASATTPSIVQAKAASTSKSVALNDPPTVGNKLVLIAGFAHTGSARTPVGDGWTPWPGGAFVISTNKGGEVWTRPVVEGDDGSAAITTSESSVYTSLALLEVANSTGVITGVVGDGGNPSDLEIPAGVTNALAIAFKYSYQMNGGSAAVSYSGTFSQVAVDAEGSYRLISVGASSAPSDGSAIDVTVGMLAGTPRSDTQFAAAFLLS